MKIIFDFESEKGIAFLQLLLKKLDMPYYNYMALLKLAFFADRYHIRNYARPVSGDFYYALKLGPVPSQLKDIIDVNSLYGNKLKRVSTYDIALKSDNIDEDQFSHSDIEAINFAIKHFSTIGSNQYNLAELTHAYPEWDKFKAEFDKNINKRVEMDYSDFLLNAQPTHECFRKLNFVDPFTPLSESERADILEEMQEYTLLNA